MKGCQTIMNVNEIQEIIKLIDKSTIEEFTYESHGTSVSLKKTSTTKKLQDAPALPASLSPEPAEAATPAERQVVERKVEEPVKEDPSSKPAYDHEIVSPMVGTFYTAPSPEKGDFVKLGSKVDKSSVVCIVEAMKLFNEIEAEVSGEIVEILVENGELVEYGQPLFRVNTK